MSKTTDALIDAGLVNTVFTDSDLTRIFDGTPARRYALTNKALKNEEIVQLKRGVYLLASKYHTMPLSEFYIASHMIPHSYVSFESALSYHGWIPERVTVITNVIHHGRSKRFLTPLGEFTYTYIPTEPFEFLTGVLRYEENKQPFLMAHPLRALADLVYYRKLDWQGIKYLLISLRIEKDNLENLTDEIFDEILKVYRSKRVTHFLTQLKESLNYHGFNAHSR